LFVYPILKLSIIVPTKNEEQNIVKLLDSISNQTLQPSEIIIADASTDNTAEVARSRGCKVVKGNGDGYIGKARNNGAKAAKSPLLLFLDADINFKNNDFLERYVQMFKDRNLDVATCYFQPSRFRIVSFLWFSFSNIIRIADSVLKRPIKINEAVILVKKKAWKDVGGFDETVRFNEGTAFFWGIVKQGCRYDALPLVVQTSDRRSNLIGIGYFLAWLKYTVGKFIGGRFYREAQDELAYMYWDVERPLNGKSRPGSSRPPSYRV